MTDFLCFTWDRHLHAKWKYAALAITVGMDSDSATTSLYNRFDDAEADTYAIFLCCLVRAKIVIKNMRKISFHDTIACVANVYAQTLVIAIVKCFDVDPASNSMIKRILY